MHGKSEQTLWDATAPPGVAWPSLQGAQDCDIAIIGAGAAGLSLALHAADRGLRPVLLEADAEAAGGAGRSAGVVAPQLVRHTPATVVKALGPIAADKLLRLVAEGAAYSFSLIGDRKKECGANQAGFLAPARGAAGADKVANIGRGWAPIRSDLQVIRGAEVEKMTGCSGYSAAILDPTGGSLNPLAYLRLLAREAVAAGAILFTGSRVTSVERQGGRWLLRSEAGQLTAARVVACANHGNLALHPALARTVLTMPVTQVATTPFSDDERRAILPGGQAMTDMEPDVLSLRFDPDGRLVTAYPIGRNGHRAPNLTSLVNVRLSGAVPSFRPKPLAFSWTGRVVINASFLPRLVALDDNFFALQACNGRGLALNTVIGRELAAWLAGERQAGWALAPETARPISGYFAAQYLPLVLMKLALLRQAGRRRPTNG
jgi:glycine/D-amino acid oxidase-like deaminating enzyme